MPPPSTQRGACYGATGRAPGRSTRSSRSRPTRRRSGGSGLARATACSTSAAGPASSCVCARIAGRWSQASTRSEAMLALARGRVPEADLRVADLQTLPFGDDAFDLVTGFGSFFYAGDVVSALTEAARVARPGGAVVVQVFGRPERCDLEALKPRPGAWRPEIVEELMPVPVEESFDITWAYEYADDTALLNAMRAAGAVAAAGPDPAAVLDALAGCRQLDGSYVCTAPRASASGSSGTERRPPSAGCAPAPDRSGGCRAAAGGSSRGASADAPDSANARQRGARLLCARNQAPKGRGCREATQEGLDPARRARTGRDGDACDGRGEGPGQEAAEDHGHDPQRVPRRGPVAGDQRDRRSRRRSTAPGTVWNELQARSSPSAPCRWRARSRPPRPTWSGCRRSRCGASRRRRTAARRRSARCRAPRRPRRSSWTSSRCCSSAARRQLQRRRGPGGVRRRAARRRRRQRRDRHRPARRLRRRLRRAADDARRDPGPARQQGEARQDPQGPLQDPLRAERRRHQDPGRPRLGLGRGRASASASSASSTPTWRRSATRRSARRRPRS